jgi:hypothetical protein
MIIFAILPSVTIGKEISNFDNGGGQPTVEVELLGEPGKCTDSTAYFSIPVHKGKIQEASLKITTKADQFGNYLLDPKLDVGVDGDYEWEYKGRGYGSFGHQNMFSSGMDRRLVAIGNNYKNNFDIYLPDTAFVTDASMKLVGGNLKYGEIYVAVVMNNGNVYYLRSYSNGNFGAPQFIGSVGSNSYGIGMGDFDDDGDYDIIVNQGWWSSPTGNIYMFRKDGPGANFTRIINPVGTTGNGRNTGFAVGDFDNDRKLDFVESEMGSNFYFFKGNGTNTFTRYKILESFSGGTPWEKDAVDFNLDGKLDMVVGGSTTKKVFVFPGKGDGTFGPKIEVNSWTGTSTWTWGSECAVGGDFNNDGNPDIIAKEALWGGDNYFRFIPGNGDLTFEDDQPIVINNLITDSQDPRADAFDFNFDGNQDIVTYDNTGSSGTLKCYWGSGNGQFKSNAVNLGSLGWGIQGITAPPSVLLGGCDNLEVDIGADGGLPDFSFNGSIDSTELLAGANFKNKLNSIISSPPAGSKKITDLYGNTLIKIPIEFRADKMGNVLAQNLSISYSYTADVDINPHNDNLVNELNDLIPQSGSGEFKVYFNLISQNPGKAKFSDLNIKFNEAPTTKKIPNLEIKEGTDRFELIDLAHYFNDDEELPEELEYSVFSNSNNEYVKVSIHNGHWLHVNATKAPDWVGDTKVVVTAEDRGKGVTKSNEITISIKPVNDPPRIGRNIDNIDLLIYSVSDRIDLDHPNKRFFYDVDSDDLYFKIIVFDEENTGKFEDYIEIDINNESNELRIRSMDKPKLGIPIRIYCSDNENIMQMNFSQLLNYPIYQHLIVNITRLGHDIESLEPPIWKDIKDIIIPEDEARTNWINLNNYTSDPDDSVETLRITVDSLTNSAFMNVFIISSKDRTQNILNIIPEKDFDGESIVTLRAEDKDHNFALEDFKITIEPKPDIPSVTILSPVDNSYVSGKIVITGSANDPEGQLELVEVKIGNNDWQAATGLTYWSFEWDSLDNVATLDEVLMKARSMDADNSYSIFDSITLNVDNVKFDSDGDTVPDIYDACPEDPLNWIDTDGDGVGDNTDDFIDDPTQWYDVDGDGYGDNIYGNSPDMFIYDPTQWKDMDGDGLGDNPDGNNPDPYPKDPSQKSTEDDEIKETTIFKSENAPYFMILILIIIDLLILNYYVTRRRKIKNEKEEAASESESKD